MKEFHLKTKELEALHSALRQEHNKRYAYRIHAVILLNTGYTLKKVKEVLFLDDETLRRYVENYRTDGISGLLSDHRGGKACSLTESEIVDSYSTINLLTAIENKYSLAANIKVILDNAKYHYSKLVRDYLSESRIDLVFLPSYSPNLNLIERLWGFFKKKVLHNRYYKDLQTFREACIRFFRTIDKYSNEISNFMNADLHIM